MKYIVDGIVLIFQQQSSIQSYSPVVKLLCLQGAILFLTEVLYSTNTWIMEIQVDKLKLYLHKIIHKKSIAIDYEFYESPHYQDTIHRAQGEAYIRGQSLLKGFYKLIRKLITFVSITVIVFVYNSNIGFLLLISIIPGLWFKIKYSNDIHSWKTKRSNIQRRAKYFNRVLTSKEFAKELRFFNAGQFFISKFSYYHNLLMTENRGFINKKYFRTTVSSIIRTICLIITYNYLVHLIFSGEGTVGTFVFIFQAYNKSHLMIEGVLDGLSSVYEDNLFVNDLFKFLKINTVNNQKTKTNKFPVKIKKGLLFKNVSFKYSSDTHYNLKNINLSVKPNETVALVGQNGSGKSTLLKLLCRLYDSQKGGIYIDEIDIKEYDIASYKKNITTVFQDYSKYKMSIKDNIIISNYENCLDIDRFKQAVKNSGVEEFSSFLEKKYDSLLGREFKGGHGLSIGQWQKIAVARSLYRKSQIAIFDEATSSIDAKTESVLLQHFLTHNKDRITFIVSHRLTNITHVDTILFMKNGMIKESGTHNELISLKGDYYKLYLLQNP